MARLRGFITSYVGLTIGSLVVILVSMNFLAVRQTDWLLGQSASHGLISFSPLELADYKTQVEARSIVIGFDNGRAGGLREAVTTLASTIPAMGQRLIDDVRRDDLARASIVTGSAFGLSADSARAVAAQAVVGTGIVPSLPGAAPPAPAAPAGGSGAAAVGPTVVPSSPTPATSAAAILSPTPTAAPAAPSASPTSARTATPTTTRAPDGGSGGGGGASAPAPAATADPGASQPAASPVPPTAVPPTAVPPTQTPLAATPVVTATPIPALSATPIPVVPTPVPATATPAPRPTDEPEPATPGPSATPTATPTGTPSPTATPREFAMDLSVVGGSSVSFQPIFSGALSFKAGESQSRTVNVQNNGTRDFRYYMGTSGGSGVLWTDTTNGLQMTVTRNGTLVYSGPISMADQQLGQLSRGGQDTLVITVSMPAAAGNSYQNQSTSVSYNFTAVAVP